MMRTILAAQLDARSNGKNEEFWYMAMCEPKLLLFAGMKPNC